MESMYLKMKNPEKNPKDKTFQMKFKLKAPSKVTRHDFLTFNDLNSRGFSKGL